MSHFDRLNIENKCFELPDGQIITIDPKIKYTAAEICFKYNKLIKSIFTRSRYKKHLINDF